MWCRNKSGHQLCAESASFMTAVYLKKPQEKKSYSSVTYSIRHRKCARLPRLDICVCACVCECGCVCVWVLKVEREGEISKLDLSASHMLPGTKTTLTLYEMWHVHVQNVNIARKCFSFLEGSYFTQICTEYSFHNYGYYTMACFYVVSHAMFYIG